MVLHFNLMCTLAKQIDSQNLGLLRLVTSLSMTFEGTYPAPLPDVGFSLPALNFVGCESLTRKR